MARLLEQLQLEIRVGAPALEASFEQCGLLSVGAWIQAPRRLVSEEEAALQEETPAAPPLQRVNNELNMEQLAGKCDWSHADAAHGGGSITLWQRARSPSSASQELAGSV